MRRMAALVTDVPAIQVGPWDENQGLKHNRNIELYLLFLTSGVSRIEGFLGAFCLR